MMKKLVISEDNDLWYCLTDMQCFQFSLLINAQPAKDVSLWEFCLDEKGKPYLFLVTKQQLECYYWDGLRWKAKEVPLILNPISIHPVFREGLEQHFLVVLDGTNFYQHYFLTDQGWVIHDLQFLDKSFSIVALIPWDKNLALIYSTESYSGNWMNFVIFDGNWNAKQRINVGSAECYNIIKGGNELLLLLGNEIVDGSCLKILRIPSNEPERIEEYHCTLKGSINKPIIISVNDNYKICWTERGKICLASLDTVNYQVFNIIESDVFSPAELISLSGKGAGYLALSVIYGTKLDFPLVLKAEAFEKMIKGHKLQKKGILQDRPGLNYRFFSRVVHNGIPERQFYK